MQEKNILKKSCEICNFFYKKTYEIITIGLREVEQNLSILLYFESLKRFRFNANKAKLLSRTIGCFSGYLTVISLPRQTNKVVYVSSGIDSIPKKKNNYVLWLCKNAVREFLCPVGFCKG